MLACTDGSGPDKDGSSHSGSVDSDLPPLEITYPTGDRVLLYYGHGGSIEQGTGKGGFEDVDARLLEVHGWSTDHRDYLPEDLSTYRMIGLIGVGTNGSTSFAPVEIIHLQESLDRGTRLVLMADREACQTEVATSLLTGLGVDLSYTGEAADYNRIIEVTSFSAQHQISTDVQNMRFKEPCWVSRDTGEVIAQDDDRNALIVSERPGAGGEVVVVANFQFFDDSGYLEYGDNARLIENLARVQLVD
jgi:hypothetical protein